MSHAGSLDLHRSDIIYYLLENSGVIFVPRHFFKCLRRLPLPSCQIAGLEGRSHSLRVYKLWITSGYSDGISDYFFSHVYDSYLIYTARAYDVSLIIHGRARAASGLRMHDLYTVSEYQPLIRTTSPALQVTDPIL